ncbi:MAG: hypothetical protein KR126chlam6_01080 [Candidatus Anoxychlamydiales bacterium]|nr:hypothetical protein [Candidatus Anoxychlamydiales bacterium]
MKKLFVISSILLSIFFSNVHADVEINYEQNKLQHYVSFGDSFIIVLDDKSIWEIFNFKPRSQTWSEWWNGVKVQMDDEFLWKVDDWLTNDKIVVRENYLDEEIFEQLKEYDKKRLRYYGYVLENTSAHKIAFARPIVFQEFTDLFIKYSEDRYSDGHSDGYNEGYCEGKSVGCKDCKSS